MIVPDFTISKYGSSCNHLFFGLFLSSFLVLSLFLGIPFCLEDAHENEEKTKKLE